MYRTTKAPWLSFVRELEELNCSGLRWLSKEPQSLLPHACRGKDQGFVSWISTTESVTKNNGGDGRLVDTHNGARIRTRQRGKRR
jgi:hypothetical protein